MWFIFIVLVILLRLAYKISDQLFHDLSVVIYSLVVNLA